MSLAMAKLFISRIEENNMMILKLGWDSQFVLSVKDAVTIAEILQKAEVWREEYVSGGGGNTFHAYPNEQKISMELVNDDLYRMAKLAGKPEKK
jgi:hypothetical protein